MTSKSPLSVTHPHLADEWHPVSNGDLTPQTITAGSGKVVWWLGKCGHEWNVKVCIRTGQNQGCPICSNKRILIGFNDLETTDPELSKEWHPVRNGPFLPTMFVRGNNKKVWWLGKCGHEWETAILYRTKNSSGCPFCSGQKTLVGFNDLSTTHPELALLWHPTKNGNLKPENVVAGSKLKVNWICSSGHEWNSPVAWQTVKDGLHCSTCSSSHLRVGVNDFLKVNPDIAAEWHPTKNTNIKPNQMRSGSHEKVWWLGSCKHEWQSTIKSRVRSFSNTKKGCPICLNQQILTGFNDLQTTHPNLAKEWHPTKNLPLTPAMIASGSNKKIWWLCSKNHEWEAHASGRSRSGYGCPECFVASRVSQPEYAITEFIESMGLTVEQNNRKILGGSEIDIYVPEKKFGIEYNGLYWHSEKMGKGRNYHYDKWMKANSAGIQLIQIWEDEWVSDPERIKNIIRHKLGVNNGVKVFARKTSVVSLTFSDAKDFFERNHIQGVASASFYYGLNDSNENLVAVLAVKKESGGRVFNIVRYATSSMVVGGFTKLLKYVETNHEFDEFVTFSDHCISDGGLYANNGFTADKEIRPDYRYVVGLTRAHKFGYRLKRFRNDPNLLWQEGLTERELADLNNIPRIWDAGKTRWVRKVR